MVEDISLQDAAIRFVACTIPRAFRRELASLLFSTQVRYLSTSFFLYLLFTERMIPWYSGCIIEVALWGSMRDLIWEYSCTWWLEALSQTYSMCQFDNLISLFSLVMIWWCISPVIQAFLEIYQAAAMSFTCILYFLCKQWEVLDLLITKNFLWSEPSMLVIISSVSLSLHFAEPVGLSSNQ